MSRAIFIRLSLGNLGPGLQEYVQGGILRRAALPGGTPKARKPYQGQGAGENK
jgi:hypothetical protein